MKKTLLFTLSVGMIYLTLSSNSSGPTSGNNPTTLATTGCTPCHGSSVNTATMGTITIKEMPGGMTVTDGKYKPGQKYEITLNGSNTTLDSFGFVMIATDNPGNAQAGVFANPGTSTQITAKSGLDVFEHSTPIAGGGTNSFSAQVEWTAPAAGTGDVTMNVAINAVNGDGGSNGDQFNTISVTLNETPTNSVSNINTIKQVNLYPNPATNNININVAGNSTYKYDIYAVNGSIISSGSFTGNVLVDITEMPVGNYFLKVSDDKDLKTIPFVKQ